jgi:serine O-acetyltransferase
MENYIKDVFVFLGTIFTSPLLLPFILTTEKETILVDVQRWVKILGWKEKAEFINLLSLLSKAKEFRNLYYYRILKGNFIAKVFMYLLQLSYKKCPNLFIDSACEIGSGLFIQHGFSTIITADMGENCWVNQQVTIGFKDKTGYPKIGNNVKITAGAKVIGNITIGDNVTIGSNAVVVKNIPDNCVVVGVPAYIVKRNGMKVREEL